MVSGDDFNIWDWLLRNCASMWGLLMLPLYVTLETALVSGVDHGSSAWKHLYALPLPRWSIYMAKQVINFGIVGLSTLILVAGALLSGLIVQASGLQPAIDYSAPVPWDKIPSIVSGIFFAAWLIIAIHTWVSMRWRSFTVASAVGIVATVVNFVLLNSRELAPYYPWTQPVVSIQHTLYGMTATSVALAIGFVGGVLFALVACWEVTRRDVL